MLSHSTPPSNCKQLKEMDLASEMADFFALKQICLDRFATRCCGPSPERTPERVRWGFEVIVRHSIVDQHESLVHR